MLEQAIRPAYQRLLVDWFANRIQKYISPFHITILGGILGMMTMFALAFHMITIAVILLLISGYCDTLDGTIARIQKQSSSFGSVLDILLDRSVEFSVILGLWLFQPTGRSLLCILMLGSILLCVTSFLVVGIFSQNTSDKSFYYSPGIIERAEAFIFFILMILMPHYFTFLALLFSLLVLITTWVRVYEFSQFSSSQAKYH